MKFITNRLLLFAASLLMLSGCDLTEADVDTEPQLTGNSESYEIHESEGSNVSGVAIVEELTDGSAVITLQLNGTESGATHPAHIHANSAAESGQIEVSLTPVDGSSGESQTTVDAFDDGIPLTYEQILNLDGHIMVHLSSTELETVIARGDIGGNALTGDQSIYPLHEANGSGVTGEVIFSERKNGNTLVVIELLGTAEGDLHTAHIHHNSVEEGGDIAVPLNSVNGATGTSHTNIRAEETDGNLSYSDWLTYDGHVNVHVSESDATVISEGDIGSNY